MFANNFIENTSTGKKVYLWFIECPEEILLNPHFIKINYFAHLKEKTNLKWFRLSEINQSNIFYRLKQAS